MYRLLLFVVFIVCVGCGSSGKEESSAAVTPKIPTASEAAPGMPPEKIFFPSDYGNVEFGHKTHFDRVNGDCATCHPSVFPQELKPLDYGKARHRSAEEYGTSCATCHGIKGTAFAAERNCQKCHDMGHKQ